MDLEQESLLLAQLGAGLLIEPAQLRHSRFPGLVEAEDLRLRVGHLPAGLGLGVTPKEAQLSGGHAPGHSLTVQ